MKPGEKQRKRIHKVDFVNAMPVNNWFSYECIENKINMSRDSLRQRAKALSKYIKVRGTPSRRQYYLSSAAKKLLLAELEEKLKKEEVILKKREVAEYKLTVDDCYWNLVLGIGSSDLLPINH